jgi:hypothetical protein
MALPATRQEREPADDALLMIGVGKPKPGAGMGAQRPGEESDPTEPDADDKLPPGFETAASEAFPDMDPSAYPALKRLIALCMGGY